MNRTKAYKLRDRAYKHWSIHQRHCRVRGIKWISLTVFRHALALRDSKPPCGICKLKTGIQIDHNHETGEFRGILCNGCNSRLGTFEDKDFNLMAGNYLSGITDMSQVR